METTTVRVHRSTQKRLKNISISKHVSITELIDRLVDEHEKSFWKGFDEESKAFFDKDEKKARETFESTIRDGFAE